MEAIGAKGILTRKTNVLFVMIQMAMGGSERLVLNLARHLDRRLFSPSIAWFAREEPLKEFQDLDIPLHYVPKEGRLDLHTMRMLGRLVLEQQIDIVNAHHFMPFFYSFYGSRIRNRVGLVYTEHSENDVASVTGKWRTMGQYLLPSCEVVGISERVSQRLTADFRLDPSHVHTIENGVDIDSFDKKPGERSALREQLGFSPNDILIGQVANFYRNKNHLFLLRAFREISRDRPEVKLVLVGQGFAGDPENSESEIACYIREHRLEDQVRLLGYRPDVPGVLGILDIFCLVSYNEGLPLSVLEAMASGLPVVGTDIEGIRGVVEPEVTGFLVPTDDVPSLTLALKRLISDPELRTRMGAASRRIAVARYSLKRCLQAMQQLFLSMLPHEAPALARPATPID
jgi:glycosyltransferase involved in cell wall biosynthesis